MNLLQRIVTTGCNNSLHEDKKRSISIVNTLCLTTAFMAIAFSTCCFFLTGKSSIVAPAMIEAVLLLSIIFLNYLKKYTAAVIAMILINNISIQYYSAVMGRVTEVHLLFIFLVGLSMLLFETPRMRKLGIGITIFCFLIGEINMYNGFILPIAPVNEHTATQFIIRWVTIPSILLLDLMVIYYYVKNVDRLRKRETRHVQEMLKKVEEHNKELELLTAKLAKATDAKTVFVRETSHEIRTPLNAIFGISQLLQMKAEEECSLAPIRQLVDHLYAASYNTREIINNVLEFSRIEAGKQDTPQPAPFNIRDWVEGIVNMHQYVANVKMVKIRYAIADAMPEMINGDKILLTKTLNNLLSNAIKFTSQESEVRLLVYAVEDQWFLEVTDEGEGISTERQSTIFNAFVTERNIFLEGTGLGLHITKHLATVLGGDVKVRSVIGKGTTFTVMLPLHVVAVDNDIIKLQEQEQFINLNDTSILVIEDDKMSQMILSRFLCGLGSRVVLAQDGIEGLLLAKASRPDIIILDSHIPGMSGKDTLEQIRKDVLLKNVPVIIASGDPFKEASEEMLKAGADEYIVKPIEFKALHATLTKYLQAGAHP